MGKTNEDKVTGDSTGKRNHLEVYPQQKPNLFLNNTCSQFLFELVKNKIFMFDHVKLV